MFNINIMGLIEASYENGILSLVVPKKELPGDRPKKEIRVK
jgi:HSP20 family molecular chaperone IbpA